MHVRALVTWKEQREVGIRRVGELGKEVKRAGYRVDKVKYAGEVTEVCRRI